ncbi:MAG: anaerobic ribonucleoside-triphosphate reductase activating protein [Candidatus Syntropharchaeia archaeon]
MYTNTSEINLGGSVSISTIDWHGKSVCIIFFRGCPLRCIYCQNHGIIKGKSPIKIKDIESEIKNNRFIDGVVFSGGEPFMQFEGLKSLAEFVKKIPLLVGIQTSGFYPERIEEMIREKLVDRIFLDVKAPLSDPELYERITGKNIVESVKKSIEICNGRVELEIVTTVFRDLIGEEEIKRISEEIKGTECTYVIQQGIPSQAPSESIRKLLEVSRDELLNYGRIARRNLKDVRIRTRDFGEEIIS